MAAQFIHLDIHSEYSLVDGLVHIKPLFTKLSADEVPAVGITDVCNFFAAVKIYKAAMSTGVKPIYGSEIWVRYADDLPPMPLVLLCLNNDGFSQITELVSDGYLHAPRYQGIPLIDSNVINSDRLSDVLVLSGGWKSYITQALVKGNESVAAAEVARLKAAFPGRFYLEIQRLGHSEEAVVNVSLCQLAAQYQVPLVATQSVRFLYEDDFDAHEIRVAIREGFALDDPKRPKRYARQQYLKSVDEMTELFADVPSALQNTVEVARRCNVTFDLDKPCLPDFPIPEGMTEAEYFRKASHDGLTERLAAMHVAADDKEATEKQYRERLDIELGVILQMGFPGYFLIVADFIQWAKDNGIPVGPGRGSGAGSLVAYALKITDIDPLPYDLLFERFLNPERVSMPDFDIDFCMDGRDRVIDYVAQKYGRDSVSQIITFGSMAAKAVVRDVGRVLGHPYGFVDGIAKLVPMDLGMTLTKALEEEPQLKERYDTDDEVRQLLDMALKLEGTVRNVGKHAGGVVIAPSKLTDFTPVYCEAGSQALVSQYDKDDVEAAGLVKFDFLGLRNLTIIDNAVGIINEKRLTQGEEPLHIDSIPLDDKLTFGLLKRHETTAVFQLESRGMKDLIRRLQPDCFEDIIALVALFRPGPLQSGMVDDFIDRKHGRAKVEFPHPDSGPILAPTYGIILYQEQVMMIAQVLGGYTLGGADLLRRAMGKKKPEEMAKQREIFLTGALENNIDEETATYIFDLMEKFAGYGFNKSHSAAYALVAYQTAYLKAHYPAEFMAAVLSSDMDNTDKVVGFIEDCENIGLQVLPPDINASHYMFLAPDDQSVRFGLGAIKGVGESAISAIVEARQSDGQFHDLFEFCRRMDLRKVNRRTIESLIYAGAFDQLAPNRATLLHALERAMQMAEQHEANAAQGQDDLFGAMLAPEQQGDHADVYEVIKPLPTKSKLLQEKQVLGFFLSGHPMTQYRDALNAMKVTRLKALRPTGRDKPLFMAGMILTKRRIKTKAGKVMNIITIDDGSDRVDVTLFPEQAEQYRHLLNTDELVFVEGDVSHDDFSGGWRVVAKHLEDIAMARMRCYRGLNLKLNDKVDVSMLQQLQQVLQQHEGIMPLTMTYCNDAACAQLRLNLKIKPTDTLLEVLKTFGQGVFV